MVGARKPTKGSKGRPFSMLEVLYHCHNLEYDEYEEMGMMRNFRIES